MNLPPVRLRASRRGDDDYVWDSLRGRWLLLTPEEWVRRHVIGWLSGTLAIPPTSIMQECQLHIGGSLQRADIVVTDIGRRAILLVECKAADVPIDGDVLAQASRYNGVLHAPYIMLTNGLYHYFYAAEGSAYRRLDTVPDLSGMYDRR